MKICPFISHMIGEDGTSVLEIDAASSHDAQDASPADDGIVILGYDGDGSGVGVETAPKKSKARPKSRSRARAKSEGESPLFCLKDTCRFYQKKGSACMFDTMNSMIERQAQAAPAPAPDKSADKTTAVVTKELDKFWKFQTRSVAEMIATIGEAEKKQEDVLGGLRADIEKKIAAITSDRPEVDLGPVRDELARLQAAVGSREEGIDNFSTTVSELVINIEDNLRALRDQSTTLVERIDSLESRVAEVDDLPGRIGSAITDRIEKALASHSQAQRPDNTEPLAREIREVVESTRKFQESISSWQQRVEARVDDLGEKQHELTDVVQSQTQRQDDESTRSRRKEARKLNNLGVTSFHNGDLELARSKFIEAVALDEQFAECYNNLGLVYTELSDDEKATEAFSRAIKLNPDLNATYNNLGYVFYRQGSYDQAIEMYKEALERSSENSSAYTNLGNAYFKQGRTEEARQAWEKAVELDPGNDRASRNLKRIEQV